MDRNLVFEMNEENGEYAFSTTLSSALSEAENELNYLTETLSTINDLEANCDRLDYGLAICIGSLSGVIDIFLVGNPKDSRLISLTDKWFDDRIKEFASFSGWRKDNKYKNMSAKEFLEFKFKVPYDQRGAGDAGQAVFGLNPSNHHFKSLAHNPSLLGLFYSILDQFYDTSHFVTEGELISLVNANGSLKLKGNDFSSKIFSGFSNWIGHLMSDVSGSSGSKGRGMGIPSPLWTWTNDIIAIKRELNFPVNKIDKAINEVAQKIYLEGFDLRFTTTQAIPVLINEVLVRLIYSIRRLYGYFSIVDIDSFSFNNLWEKCEPFSNPSVKRMLTVAHGTFCMVDLSEAIINSFVLNGGTKNVYKCLLRVNVVGIRRLSISLFGEASRLYQQKNIEDKQRIIYDRKEVVNDYLDGLKQLANDNQNESLIELIKAFESSDMYKMVFNKTIRIAMNRNVADDMILKNIDDIDSYFRGVNDEEK